MRRESLSKSVSKSEMMALRESGMSNVEIANAVGACPDTILKYIGKQPREITAANRAKGVKRSWDRRRAAEAASRSTVEVVARSVAEIVQESKKEMAREDAARAKADAVKRAAPIIKSTRLVKEVTASKRKRLVECSRSMKQKKAKVVVQPEVKSSLKVSDHVIHLESDSASYQFNASAQNVHVTMHDSSSFNLPIANIPTLLSDLDAIYKNANSQKYTCKAW